MSLGGDRPKAISSVPSQVTGQGLLQAQPKPTPVQPAVTKPPPARPGESTALGFKLPGQSVDDTRKEITKKVLVTIDIWSFMCIVLLFVLFAVRAWLCVILFLTTCMSGVIGCEWSLLAAGHCMAGVSQHQLILSLTAGSHVWHRWKWSTN